MVTASHVLTEMQGETAILHLRRKVDEKTNTWVDAPSPVPIRANNQPLWIKHPEADVAVTCMGRTCSTPLGVSLFPTPYATPSRKPRVELQGGEK